MPRTTATIDIRSEASGKHRDSGGWVTVALWAAVWTVWLFLTTFHATIPWPVLLLLGGMVNCTYGSLQHEAVHGHLSPRRSLNRWAVAIPLGLVYPFSLYQSEHLAHHAARRVTDPEQDPESFYVYDGIWNRLPGVVRGLLWCNQTVAGRMVLGPWIATWYFYRRLFRRSMRFATVKVAVSHLAGVTLVLWWIGVVCDMPLWQYVVFFAWPGLALTLLRSFHEHQPANQASDRTLSVEAGLLCRLLFLNNNYHRLHHARPELPWYRLHRLYDPREADPTVRFGGYGAIIRRYLFKPKDPPFLKHPPGMPVSGLSL
jgi:fatty acid desaturase